MKPNQFSDFLDWLEKNGKHQLRLAVGLVGYFGLRECELALLMPVETPNGLRLKVGMQAKNNAKTAANGARKPRLAMHAVCEGRPANEVLDMLAQYRSELVRLPKRLRKQIDLVSEKGFFRDVGDAFSEQIKATDFWKDLVKAEPFLDRSTPGERPKSLFIATDSGVAPLKKSLEDLGVDPDEPLLKPNHPEQMIWIWGHAADQGHESWSADINGVVDLRKFVMEKNIAATFIDSA